MASTSKLLAAKVLLTVVAVFTIVAPVLADWNATLFFVWRHSASLRTASFTALLFAALYWISQTLAFLFPGVAWTDPNLLSRGQSLEDFPLQIKVDLVVFAVLIANAWLIAGGTSTASSS